MNPKILYYPNGNKKVEKYSISFGESHNESGPSLISYYENGNKEHESYSINGEYHNIKGPAMISYDENGNITSKIYWVNNKLIRVNSDEEFQKYIKRLNIS